MHDTFQTGQAMVERIARSKVVARPLSLYHVRQPGSAKCLLLGYGAVQEDEIAANFARLAHAAQHFL